MLSFSSVESKFKEKLLFLASIIPLILVVVGSLTFQSFLSVLYGNLDYFDYLLRAIDISQRGLASIFSIGSLETSFHGYMLVYPPLITVLVWFFGLFLTWSQAHAALTLLQMGGLILVVWLVSFEAYGPVSALVASSMVLVSIPLIQYFMFPNPSTFSVICLIALCYAVLKQNQVLACVSLVAGAYFHFMGFAIIPAVAAYYLLDCKRSAWLEKPLVWSTVLVIPWVVWMAVHPLLYAEAVNHIMPHGYLTNVSVSFLAVAAVGLWYAIATVAEPLSAFILVMLLATNFFWFAFHEYDRGLIATAVMLSIAASGIFHANGSRVDRKKLFAGFLIAVIAIAFSVSIDAAFQVNQFLPTQLRIGDINVNGIPTIFYYINLENLVYTPIRAAGRQTVGLEDAARAIDAFTAPNERIGVIGGGRSVVGVLAERNVSFLNPYNTSNCNFNVFPPVSYSCAQTRITLEDNGYQALANQTVLYRGLGGTLVANTSNLTAITCFGKKAYCQALMQTDPSYCALLSGEEKENCILDVSTTANSTTLCDSLRGNLANYCLLNSFWS